MSVFTHIFTCKLLVSIQIQIQEKFGEGEGGGANFVTILQGG